MKKIITAIIMMLSFSGLTFANSLHFENKCIEVTEVYFGVNGTKYTDLYGNSFITSNPVVIYKPGNRCEKSPIFVPCPRHRTLTIKGVACPRCIDEEF